MTMEKDSLSVLKGERGGLTEEEAGAGWFACTISPTNQLHS